MKRMIGAAVLAASATLAGPAPSQQAQQAITATYLCEGGKVLQIAFLNLGEMSAAVVHWTGELVPLRQVPSGSGVFYADFDEQRGLRWRGKGDEGFLAELAPDHTADERVLVASCKAVEAR